MHGDGVIFISLRDRKTDEGIRMTGSKSVWCHSKMSGNVQGLKLLLKHTSRPDKRGVIEAQLKCWFLESVCVGICGVVARESLMFDA